MCRIRKESITVVLFICPTFILLTLNQNKFYSLLFINFFSSPLYNEVSKQAVRQTNAQERREEKPFFIRCGIFFILIYFNVSYFSWTSLGSEMSFYFLLTEERNCFYVRKNNLLSTYSFLMLMTLLPHSSAFSFKFLFLIKL